MYGALGTVEHVCDLGTRKVHVVVEDQNGAVVRLKLCQYGLYGAAQFRLERVVFGSSQERRVHRAHGVGVIFGIALEDASEEVTTSVGLARVNSHFGQPRTHGG